MSDSVRESYTAGIDSRFVPIVLALDRAVLAACPDLNCRIYYRMLTYTLGGDNRHWICAAFIPPKTARSRRPLDSRAKSPRRSALR